MDTATTVYSSFFCCMTWLSIQVPKGIPGIAWEANARSQWTEYVPGRKAWNISCFIVSSHASSVSVAALLDAGCIDSEICTANLRPHCCCSNQLRLYKSTEWFQHVILLHWKCLSRLHHTKWKLEWYFARNHTCAVLLSLVTLSILLTDFQISHQICPQLFACQTGGTRTFGLAEALDHDLYWSASHLYQRMSCPCLHGLKLIV